MQVGLNLGYTGAAMADALPLVEHAERVGVASVWVAEAYGSDAVTVLGYLAGRTERMLLGSAILQIPARTPATTPMTAMTLDALSCGRLVLGLGVSGPQVVEGWHGVAYGRPLAKTREYVAIVRQAIAREEALSYDGEHYRIPYTGPDATGLGKPLKSILHPVRSRIPIYLAAIGPRNISLAAELADGWLPLFYSPERADVFADDLRSGFEAAGRAREELHVAALVQVAAGEDVQACRDALRPTMALYLGGMGPREQNFYHDLACRYGYEAAADRVQELYLDGHRDEATAAVPDELIDELCLVGPLPRIRERLEAWKASDVDTLILGTTQPEVLETICDAL
ncbi:MAG: LLM class F420-dependent oxidoreductase [Egibacteraceae bacterium]